MPMTLFRVPSVGLVIDVTVNTRRDVSEDPPNVLPLRNGLEVVRVDAGPIAAQVIDR